MKAKITRKTKAHFWAIVTSLVVGDVKVPFEFQSELKFDIKYLEAFKKCFKID